MCDTLPTEKHVSTKSTKHKVSPGLIIFLIILFAVGVVVASKVSAKKKKEKALEENLVGKSFSGSYFNDGGYFSATEKTREQLVFYADKYTYTVTFLNDGKVDVREVYDHYRENKPDWWTKYDTDPNDFYQDKTDRTSYSVAVETDGTAYVIIRGSKYELSVNARGQVTGINDYGIFDVNLK